MRDPEPHRESVRRASHFRQALGTGRDVGQPENEVLEPRDCHRDEGDEDQDDPEGRTHPEIRATIGRIKYLVDLGVLP